MTAMTSAAQRRIIRPGGFVGKESDVDVAAPLCWDRVHRRSARNVGQRDRVSQQGAIAGREYFDSLEIERLLHGQHDLAAVIMFRPAERLEVAVDRRLQTIGRGDALNRVERLDELRHAAAVVWRRRGMAGRASGRDTQPHRDLLRNLDAPEGDLVDDGLVVAAFVEYVPHVGEQLRGGLEYLLASTKSSHLLLRDGEIDDIAAKRDGAALQLDDGHRLGNPKRLEIERAPAP